MKEVIEVILNNHNLREEVKVLLVKHGYYREARDLRDYEKVVDLEPHEKKAIDRLGDEAIEQFKNIFRINK